MFPLVAVILFSCAGGGANGGVGASGSTWDTTLAKARVIDSVQCPYDQSLSYALYLPASYTPAHKYPCIYFFDSHGNGALPLRKYHALADEFGFIMIGSNISRNGMSWQEANDGVVRMMDDSKKRVHLDTQRIYTAGFSGGAKVAGSVAVFDGGIAGVIACGGGLPPLEQEIQTHFDYFTIVGRYDFNLTGLEILNEKLGQYGFNQMLITFAGKHEWPGAADFRTAVLWMQVNAVKQRLLTTGDKSIKALRQDMDDRIEQAQRDNDLVTVKSLMGSTIHALDSVDDVSSYKKDLELLEMSPDLRSAIAAWVERQHNEMNMQDTLSRRFNEQYMKWWSRELEELALNIKTAEKRPDADMYHRVVNYLGMIGYLAVNHALATNNLAEADDCLKKFKLVDPQNADCAYLSAVLSARAGKNDEALKALAEAARMGYSEPYRLTGNPDFAGIAQLPEYAAVLQAIYQNARK